MASLGLHHLPREIVHMILDHLAVDAPWHPLSDGPKQPYEPAEYIVKRQLLRDLCLVSRQLRQVVEPILYREFMPGYGESWRSSQYPWDRRLTTFMRTVAHRRDLAACVKRVDIYAYLMPDLRIENPDGSIAPQCSHERAARPPGSVSWREAHATLQKVAQALETDALRTLLPIHLLAGFMAELPNLEHLTLRIGQRNWSMLGAEGLRAAQISSLPIKIIDIRPAASQIQVPNGQLLRLDECTGDLWSVCPFLETVNLHMCERLWTRLTPFPSLPQLTTLRLTATCLRNQDLQDILSTCQALRHFHYESTRGCLGDTNSFNRGPAVRLGEAVTFLERQQATLETLHLDGRKEGTDGVFGGGSELGPVVSFREFPVLHHLFLNVDEILHRLGERASSDDSEIWVQMLPPSITSLHLASTIQEARGAREEHLMRGLADAVLRGNCPTLRQVRWGRRTKTRGKTSATLLAVNAMFAAAGVDFIDAVWPGSPTVPSITDNDDLGYYHFTPQEVYPSLFPLPEYDHDMD